MKRFRVYLYDGKVLEAKELRDILRFISKKDKIKPIRVRI